MLLLKKASGLLKLSQTTTKPPPGEYATAGVDWVSRVKVLTWNCVPRGLPSAAKRWPWMLSSELSSPTEPILFHTTRSSPPAPDAMSAGNEPVVGKVSALNSPPSGLPSPA